MPGSPSHQPTAATAVAAAPSGGFTLLEVLVSVAIFAVLITMVLTATGSLVRVSRDRGEDGSPQEAAATCFHRIFMDLQSIHVAMPPAWRTPDAEDIVDPYRVTGSVTDTVGNTFGRLRFASLSHLPMGPDPLTGVAEIVYYVEDEDDGFTLRRADRILPADPDATAPPDPVLCRNIAAFDLVYYDHEFNAHDRWDSEDEAIEYATPAAVKVRIGIRTEADVVAFETLISLPVVRGGQIPDTI